MARLLSQINREIELGNNIDLSLLLTLLGNVFLPQDDPAKDNLKALQAALIASVSVAHVPQQQRQNEPKSRQADLGNDEFQQSKRNQDAGYRRWRIIHARSHSQVIPQS